MKILKTPENYRRSQLINPNLIDEYDGHFPQKSTYYDREPIGFQFSKRVEERIDPPYISLDVSGEIYNIPGALFDLVDEINDSKYILNSEDNWDELGAVIISKELYKTAIRFLLLYMIYIYDNHGKAVISSPEINPCSNGTIDFSWKTTKARMLINVSRRNEEHRATFYYYLYNNKHPKEGLIDMLNVEKETAAWMVNLK